MTQRRKVFQYIHIPDMFAIANCSYSLPFIGSRINKNHMKNHKLYSIILGIWESSIHKPAEPVSTALEILEILANCVCDRY